MRHGEWHKSGRIGWLRAAVLGANDGIVSTASLVIGVATAGATRSAVLIAGTAGLVAGAMSMAAGEYVSVSSQSDTERSDLARERKELETDVEAEHQELAAIYVGRGLDPALATQVSNQLMAHDALGAHARDELGISEILQARPVQAAIASALSFAVGAALPIATVVVAPQAMMVWMVAILSLAFLAILGGIAARVGGARISIGATRVTFWGALAMALTAAVGSLFGVIACTAVRRDDQYPGQSSLAFADVAACSACDHGDGRREVPAGGRPICRGRRCTRSCREAAGEPGRGQRVRVSRGRGA